MHKFEFFRNICFLLNIFLFRFYYFCIRQFYFFIFMFLNLDINHHYCIGVILEAWLFWNDTSWHWKMACKNWEWIFTTFSCQVIPEFVWFILYRSYVYLRHSLTSDFVLASSKKFLDIQATIECWFTLKRVRDMARTYSQTVRYLRLNFL